MSIKAANSNAVVPALSVEHLEYVTVFLGGQMFGLPIERVQDVFMAATFTRVPLAPREIVGLLNLRGRVVTALCLRRRLGLPDAGALHEMAVGVERGGELYGLLVDEVGEVLKLPASSLEPNPVHMDPCWARLSRGVHPLNDRLLIVLDVDAVLALEAGIRAA